MSETYRFHTEEKLQQVIKTFEKLKCTKVRVFERDKSYEDYSISYSLKGNAIWNFTVTREEEVLVIRKKDPKSTRHIQFPAEALCLVEYVDKKHAYLALKIQDDVFYTDGTHRYRKK